MTIELRASFGVGGPDARSVAFTPDGRRLAVGHLDGVVRVWDVATGMATLSLKPHDTGATSVTGLRFSPDGRWLAAVAGDATRLLDAGPPPSSGNPQP